MCEDQKPITGGSAAAVEPPSNLSPAVLVLNRVMSPGSRYSPSERLVAIAIARALNRETLSWSIPYKRIAQETGYSVRQVGRAVRVLANGDSSRSLLPMFATSPSGPRTGVGRQIRFTLVQNVTAFAAKRKQFREPRHAAAAAVVGSIGSGHAVLDERCERLREEHAERKRELSLAVARGKLTDAAFRIELEKLKTTFTNQVLYAPSSATSRSAVGTRA